MFPQSVQDLKSIPCLRETVAAVTSAAETPVMGILAVPGQRKARMIALYVTLFVLFLPISNRLDISSDPTPLGKYFAARLRTPQHTSEEIL